ncbi:aldolase [Microbacterium mangrovi]|uniref:Aldolase n=1 Tax=Microbacterium mangrovi TaxID=1348253 RepID=A0A0B2A3L5_9MICO|nr:aldolase [Microbacterium mangrovi]KHK97640.1 aldolase [Microbacterium mangrovi]
MASVLTDADRAGIDAKLAATDELLATAYPGDDGSRQPIHTVYVPGDTYTHGLEAAWGAAALQAAEAAGGLAALASRVGVQAADVPAVASRVEAKLAAEPIEDLRLDFEDGYGDRGAVEDQDALRAAELVAESVASGSAAPFIGIRFKCFEAPTRARGLRTLDVFLGGLMDAGGLPDGLTLTLPKVSTVAQVEAMADAAAAIERAHGLPDGRIRFEVQVETPQLILGATGRSPLAELPTAVPGRITAFHYGTYDYSASLGISARYQSMEHPVADLAKEVMQLAAAGTGIRISDGSTNILPVGERAEEAWALHARLVRRSLERGVYQGWDMHAHNLATRYLATYAFYREGYPASAVRLRNYLQKAVGAVLDEPATARALAWFVLRGVQCGAIGADEVQADIGITEAELTVLAHPRLAAA